MSENLQTVKCLTAKQIKKLVRKEFETNPDKYYPTKKLAELGYERRSCADENCTHYFWRYKGTSKTTCGDSNCEKRYTFIGRGTGIGRRTDKEGKERKERVKLTYGDAWKGFAESLGSARVPCTAVDRYPVVARWRADVDYVAAGIFCFQPYCVTGELEPPANPLIQPQFCMRFNDLDNIGLTGRHYSGFIMLGIQVFNKGKQGDPGFKFWHADCVEFNFNWLTKMLGIDPAEITFIEDVWAGGGNLGPSIEYFVSGLEVGNMVFMQFKTFPDGSLEELDVKVIDVGIGLERIPWLINGSPTSYDDVFPKALATLKELTGLKTSSDVWEKFGPYSCLLNVDEVDDLSKTWEWIGKQVGMSVEDVRQAVEPIRDAYIVADHTRNVLMAVSDGSLPSNVGGACNVRNVLRRVFATLERRGWWEKMGMDGLMAMFEAHKEDMAPIYGKFPPYKSFRAVIELEYQRWKTTDEKTLRLLSTLLNKKKKKLKKGEQPTLSVEEWITAVTSWGVPADVIAKATQTEVPGDLYARISELQESTMRQATAPPYATSTMPPTHSLYFDDHLSGEFKARILKVFPNLTAKSVEDGGTGGASGFSIVAMDRSAFYPTSGGQQHDTGKLVIAGKEYAVSNVVKMGPAVLHVLDEAVPEEVVEKTQSFYETLSKALAADEVEHASQEQKEEQKCEDGASCSDHMRVATRIQKVVDSVEGGVSVTGAVCMKRRRKLQNHHTATHIVYASCRKVLGPHVWQNGAKKTVKGAHLDITHFRSLTFQEIQAIEKQANQIVHDCKDINKSFMAKDEAERDHGFHLYQGGVVPGNELRVVNISDTDVEACCGTHCDSTAEVGAIKITKSSRVSDGIVRLYYVAGDLALQELGKQASTIHSLYSYWNVPAASVQKKGEDLFDAFKSFKTQTERLSKANLRLQLELHLAKSSGEENKSVNAVIVRSTNDSPSTYISHFPLYAKRLQAAGVGVIGVGPTFFYAVLPEEQKDLVEEITKVTATLTQKFADYPQEKKDALDAKPKGKIGLIKTNNKGIKVKAPSSNKPGKKKKGKPELVKGLVELRCMALPFPEEFVKAICQSGAYEIADAN